MEDAANSANVCGQVIGGAAAGQAVQQGVQFGSGYANQQANLNFPGNRPFPTTLAEKNVYEAEAACEVAKATLAVERANARLERAEERLRDVRSQPVLTSEDLQMLRPADFDWHQHRTATLGQQRQGPEFAEENRSLQDKYFAAKPQAVRAVE